MDVDRLSERLANTQERVARITSYLESELGMSGNTQGNVNRRIHDVSNEAQAVKKDLADVQTVLRGEGDEIGIVGWMNIFRRTWVTGLALITGSLGLVGGWVLNEIIGQ